MRTYSIAIVYNPWSWGNTEKIAKRTAEALNAEVCRKATHPKKNEALREKV